MEIRKPDFEVDGIQLYQGDYRELMPFVPFCDVCISDPPFSEDTHKGARTNAHEGELIKFDSFTVQDVRDLVEAIAIKVKRWIILTVDWKHMLSLHDEPPKGSRFIRHGIYDKPNGAPQKSGDRPGMGWEAVAILHRDQPKGQSRRIQWNGHGRRAVWRFPREYKPGHPTAKPTDLYLEWVRLFSNAGELLFDPMMGRGTLPMVARRMGRRCIGIEREQEWFDLAVKNVKAEATPIFDTRPIAQSEMFNI